MDEFMESTSGGPKLPALKFAKVGWVFVFTLDTPTGASNLWVRGQMVKAIREAAEKASVKTLVGSTLSVRYTGDGEKKSAAFNAPKLYAAKVEPAKNDASAEMW
jgi:hypothetical protein